MEAVAQQHTGECMQLLSTAEISIHSQVVKVHRQPSDINVSAADVCHFQESVCLTKKKHIFCVSVEEIASNLNANILRSSSGGQPLWRHWCISALSHLMNLNLGSDESSHYWVLLLIRLPYTYCLQWASLLPEEPASLRPGPSVFRSEGEVTLARTRWPRKHSRGSDVEIKAGRRTAPTLHSVSPHLFVPLIQACSIPVPLIASTFSKGRGIRSASIPPLCLILFCPFVVAWELIKKALNHRNLLSVDGECGCGGAPRADAQIPASFWEPTVMPVINLDRVPSREHLYLRLWGQRVPSTPPLWLKTSILWQVWPFSPSGRKLFKFSSKCQVVTSRIGNLSKFPRIWSQLSGAPDHIWCSVTTCGRGVLRHVLLFSSIPAYQMNVVKAEEDNVPGPGSHHRPGCRRQILKTLQGKFAYFFSSFLPI